MSFVQRFDNGSSAANGSGRFAARMASFLLVITGIALAVSVVFFSADVLAVRLLGIIIISLILSVIIILPPPLYRKR